MVVLAFRKIDMLRDKWIFLNFISSIDKGQIKKTKQAAFAFALRRAQTIFAARCPSQQTCARSHNEKEGMFYFKNNN
jgi:hypothetical protein